MPDAPLSRIDPPLIFAPHHSRVLGERVAAAMGQSLAACEEREFEGGEHKMRALQDVRGRRVLIVQSLCGDEGASANDKLCRLLFFIGAVKDAGASHVTALTPYLCYARKDRRTKPYDPTTTRYVATVLEAVGMDELIVVDVHNEAAFDNAFRCPTIRIEGAAIFSNALSECCDLSCCVVASPDVGGIKRAQRLREHLVDRFEIDAGFAFMEKRRSEGVVSGDALIGDVAGRDVILHDDMIVTGGTIQRATQAARDAGARRVVVAATHPAFAPQAQQLFKTEGPDLVLVSDSIAVTPAFATHAPDRLRICPIAPVLVDHLSGVQSS